ncbi:MAG: hypothetical protein FWE95_06145 [Planctomycetaceae bacterium]|nr:hypothetical protein [Planctomycetaceae bacterium]
MKTHWTVLNIGGALSIAGIILLAGNVVGSEVRWGKPANSEPAVSSVIQITTVMTQDKAVESFEVVQTQYTPPGMPRVAPTVPVPGDIDYIDVSPQDRPVPPGAMHTTPGMPQMAPPVMVSTDQEYIEVMPPSRSVPSGATFRNVLPVMPGTIMPGNAQTATGRGLVTSCGDQIVLKSIRDISHDIRPAQTDQLPEECAIDSPIQYGRHFGQTCFMWKASALSTQVAYFEDVQLERYGNTIVCPELQPFVSGAKFFVTIPFLPYKMGVTPPNECVYTLGYHRPGDCTPFMVQPCPISPRGALFQTLAVTGAAFAIP